MLILVELKMAYGRKRYYPINDQAKLLAELMDSVSFTEDNLKAMKQLGMTIELKAPV